MMKWKMLHKGQTNTAEQTSCTCDGQSPHCAECSDKAKGLLMSYGLIQQLIETVNWFIYQLFEGSMQSSALPKTSMDTGKFVPR